VAKTEGETHNFEEPILEDITMTPAESDAVAFGDAPSESAGEAENSRDANASDAAAEKPAEDAAEASADAASGKSNPDGSKSGKSKKKKGKKKSKDAKDKKGKKKSEPEKPEPSEWDDEAARKRKASMLYLTLSGLMLVPIVFIAIAHFHPEYLPYPVAVFLIGVVFVPWALWLTRKSNTVYTAFLGLTALAMLAASCFLWNEWLRYNGEIKPSKSVSSAPVTP
jgi:hypothetical protein